MSNSDVAAQTLAAADTLYQFERVTAMQIAPDGRSIALTRERIDRQTEKRYSNLWVISTHDGAARRFTYGNHVDASPRWSPDGRQIAFLSNRKEEGQMQLYVIPFDGGEAQPVTDLKGSFQGFSWSPDGKRIAFAFRQKDAAALEREADEQKKKLGVVARHITRVVYKLNGAGYLPAEHTHIWVLEVDSGETRQLTSGDYDESAPCWSLDGATLLFVSNRSPDPDFDDDAVELYTVPAAGGEITLLPTHEGSKHSPSYAPDGSQIAYLGRRYKESWWQNTCLYLAPADGGQARNLTAERDLHFSQMTNGDVYAALAGDAAPQWSPDGRWLYASATLRGDQPVLRVNVETGEYERLTPAGAVLGYQLDASGRYLAYVNSTFHEAGQLYWLDLESGESRQLTHDNAWLQAVRLGGVEEMWIPGPDDGRLHGWMMTPPDFDPGRRYPTILQIHGGPQTQYGNRFMHEFHYLAAQGYVVGFCNPRGSQGYGDDFARAIHTRWGSADYDDVMAWADHMAGLPYVDVERFGVTGGSYGGFMTTLIITRTHRFKAAVAQRLVANWISMYGSCDFNWGWKILAGVGDPWQDFERHWQQSPLSQIGNARTPTLIIHSEEDYRTNLEQAEQVYVALKVLGVETEMVLFPGETHDLSRGGRTDRRVARLEHIRRWFDRYLRA